MDDRALSFAQKRLVLLIVQTEVPDEQYGLVKELLAVFLLVRGLCCVEEDVVKEVVQLLLDLEVTQ